MSTYIPIAIDEKAYEQAQRDAMVTCAPQGLVLGGGFAAGLVATWLPAVVIVPLLFIYKRLLADAWMTAEEKAAAAAQAVGGFLGSYASVAIWLGLALGLYGILQAYLRRNSALNNKYWTFEMARYGELRLGLDSRLTIFGFPVAAVIALMLANQAMMLFVAIFLVVLSGFFYNILWTKLHSMFIGMFFHPDFDTRAGMALSLMIPRHVGWNKCRVHSVQVNRAEKTVRVEGEFESEIDEKEARNCIAHFMRGYHPIYLINKKKSAS